MRLAVVIATDEPETVYNALRLANFARGEGDEVGVFLLGRGVELERLADPRFDVRGQAERLVAQGGRILACGTCLQLRDAEGWEVCPVSTMRDLYTLIREADRIVTF